MPTWEHDVGDIATGNDGPSVAEWYNGSYSSGSPSCDAICSGIGDQLAQGTGASATTAVEGEAATLAETVGGSDFLAGAAAAFPEVAGAVAAGAGLFYLGSKIFGTSAETGTPFAGWSLTPAWLVSIEQTTLSACPTPPAGTTCNRVGTGSGNWLVYYPTGATPDTSFAGTLGNDLGPGVYMLPNSNQNGYSTLSYEQSNPYGGSWQCLQTSPGFCEPYAPAGVSQMPSGTTQTPTVTVPAEPPADSQGSSLLSQLSANPPGYKHLLSAIVNVVDQVSTTHAYPASCSLGAPEAKCVSDLAAAGFTDVNSTQLTEATSDHSYSADAITALNPAGQACYSCAVSVTYNPDTMPLEIPAPTPGEVGSTYVTQLGTEGFTAVQLQTATDTTLDPAKNPSEVINVNPGTGSWVDPATAITVTQNPADAPQPGSSSDPAGASGGGAPSGPTEPGFNVPSPSTPCTVFPFGIPCWISNQLSQFSAAATAPSFSIGLPSIAGGASLDVNLDHPFGADLSGIMAVARPVLLVLSLLGLVVWLGGMAMGGSTGGGGSEGDE